jgi:tetraacyldisaccharide 4'-kinase
VPIDEPPWWYRQRGGVLPRLLAPVSAVWGRVAERRFRKAAHRDPGLPVICVGNLTAGGTGKTPLTLALAARLTRLGLRPAILTRGYGGRLAGPHWVDPDRDSASDVGDEPLLLARAAATLVARDRVAGGERIAAEGRFDAILMDDGLQNGSLAKSLTIAVVDGRRGLGNGRVLPAGPLRAPLNFQLGLVDALVVNAPEGATEAADRVCAKLRERFPGPILRATTRPAGDVAWLAGLRVIAFSGIGAPERFFGLLERSGATVLVRRAFPDHHAYAEPEATRLLADAAAAEASLVTTEKDWVRLAQDGDRGRLRKAARTVPIRVAFDPDDDAHLEAMLGDLLRRRAARA